MSKTSAIDLLATNQNLFKLVNPGPDDPWRQRHDLGEKDMWYSRFLIFLSLWPERSVNQAFIQWKKDSGKAANQVGAPAPWYDVAMLYQWADRARAHDAAFRAEIMREEIAERFELHRQRLREIKAIKADTLDALSIADLPNISREDALYHLNTLRQLYVDLFKMERVEMGMAAETTAEAPASTATFTADDFTRADEELRAWLLAQNAEFSAQKPAEPDKKAE